MYTIEVNNTMAYIICFYENGQGLALRLLYPLEMEEKLREIEFKELINFHSRKPALYVQDTSSGKKKFLTK